jgi:4-amino-4-deoxy-L-arabinose transferase-like glycosyltransferase
VARPFRIALIVLFLATLARSLAFAVALPAWQGPDEPAHYAYVERLATGGFPPFQGANLVFSDAVNVSVQRTITSFRERRADRPLTAQAERALLTPERGGLSTAGNSTLGARSYPPLYYVTLLPAYWLGGNTATNRLYAMRFVNALYGALFALAIALLVYEVTRRRQLSLAAGLLASLPPVVSQASATCTPDIALALFATLSCWAVVRLRPGAGRSDLAKAAAALLAVALTKPVGVFLALVILVAIGWPWLRPAARGLRPVARLAIGAIALATLWFAGNRAVDVAGATRHGTLPAIRYGLSYLWQYYLPRLSFMNPAFQRSVLTDPLPLWGTWVRTGAGSFGWLSAWLPHWAYLVAIAGTLCIVLSGIAAIVRNRASEVSRTARRAIYGIVGFILVLHVTEIVSLINGTGLVLQGRYAMPAIPLMALAFTAPLVHLSERVRSGVLAASLATWGLVSIIGFASLISFFST